MVQTINLSTGSRTQLIDITHQIEQVVSAANVDSGICLVHVPHTTAAITVNENADPAVPTDIVSELNKIVPFDDNYRHLEGNAAAHIKSTLVGCSQTLIIKAGKLALGRWQALFFCEFDGPRNRQVMIKIVKG